MAWHLRVPACSAERCPDQEPGPNKRRTMTSMATPGSFGRLLRHHRRDAGLTQEELAERAELSPRGLAYLETGRRSPHHGTVRQLADGAVAVQLDAIRDADLVLPATAQALGMAEELGRPLARTLEEHLQGRE